MRPYQFMGREHGSETKQASHEPDGRASLSPASRVGRVPRTSSGSLKTTRPTVFTGNVSPRCSVWNAAKKNRTVGRACPQRAESDVFHARRAAR
ncbi:MAG: hypothetical protein FJ398_00015 [Verrucomicrobia bacterium]|nr:hypothetical protein [Verrucomicrobiota bacterium]